MGIPDVQELWVINGRFDDGPVEPLRLCDQRLSGFDVAAMQAPDGIGRRSDDLPARRDGVFSSREPGIEKRADRLGDLRELLRHP